MSGVVEEGAGGVEEEGGVGLASPSKKRKRRAGPPVGVYDPHTHITHGESRCSFFHPHRDESLEETRRSVLFVSILASAAHHLFSFFPLPCFLSVRSNTQPTRATLTRVSDLPSLSAFNPSDPNAVADDPSPTDRKPFAVLEAIGGQRVGTSSWGLASVVLGMELTAERDEAPTEFGVPGLNEEEEVEGEPVQV